LTILAAGAQQAARVNHAAFVRQRETLNTGWLTLGEWMSTHPPLARRLVQVDPTLGPRRVGMAGPLRTVALLALILAPLAALGWVRHGHRPIRRGDAVVYRHEDGTSFVHRVVGLPGDTLAMRRFRLELNGTPVTEPYASVGDSTEYVAGDFAWQRDYRPTPAVAGEPPTSSGTWGPLVVPPGQLFLLGDRRDRSLDSRYIGFVSTDRVWGRPVWIYFSRDPERGRIRWSRVGRGVR
ncbi:MAG TPA: signal peptidase I, partial [Gemmatimonadaceae bacterium]|nr:signal peptidase I [Gemmatimonadaceae bacterium]